MTDNLRAAAQALRDAMRGTDAQGHPWGPEMTALRAALDRPAPVTVDSAYRERNAVVSALIRVGGYRAWRVLAPDAEGWWIVYAETPQGQVSWHVSAVDIRLFDDVPVGDGPWDGHSTDEKYDRVAALDRPSPSNPVGFSTGSALDVDRLARALFEVGDPEGYGFITGHNAYAAAVAHAYEEADR